MSQPSDPSTAELGRGWTDPGTSETPSLTFHGGRWMSGFPIVFFILWAIVQSGLLRITDVKGLVVGILLGLILGMLFVRGSWKDYANTLLEGMTQPVAATAIVAWLWAGMFADTLQAGQFVEGLVWLAGTTGVGQLLFPALSFLLAALLATGIGTGYGTTIAFMTLFFPAGLLLGANPVVMFGAILSGAVFGDNLAPVSDTTIVSAITQDADIGGVVASRFKYALVAGFAAFLLYLTAGAWWPGVEVSETARGIFVNRSNPRGLVHLASMALVIVTAVRGRHIVEAISWGLFAAVGLNLLFGLAAPADILVFRVPEDLALGESLASLPVVEMVPTAETGVGGSLYTGAAGFFSLSVLVLLIVAGAQITIRGGGFSALQNWLLERLVRTVRGAELTMVLSTALVNAMITINTAAEIAIAPYIARIGKRFNLNGYRRANILDANTSALGYIFPWSGGVLIGYSTILGLPAQYEWFTHDMIVNPVDVWPFVFHGWLLLIVFIAAAWTGFGREYTTDRLSGEVTRL